jgi:hypothetical protein
MSCGKLHEPGGGFDLHADGGEHHHEHPEGEGPAQDAEHDENVRGPVAEDAPRRPGWAERLFGQMRTAASGAWHQNGFLVKPFMVIPAMEGSEWFIEQLYGGDWARALAAAGVVTLLGEGTSEVLNHRHRTLRPVRARSRAAVAAAGAMTAIGGAGVFDAWTALATLVVGATTAGMVAYEESKSHGKRHRPATVLEAPAQPQAITTGPDQRLVQFTERFCAPERELAGVIACAFREVGNGFMFELDLTGTHHSPSDVANLRIAIAKLYDIHRDGVEAGYIPDRESENYAQVVISKIPVTSTGARPKPKVKPWNGLSTWNPATGTVDLGWFTDERVTHYQFHRPGSGALMGQVAGVQGAGKTGTINVLGAEAGLAKLCSRCGRAGTVYSPGQCAGACDMHRVMGVWMGDAQEQGLAVWNGYADLTGWGVEGCVELLEFADQVSAARGKFLAARQWTDTDPVTRQRRLRTGQGFFNVEIGLPLIFLVMDEFPMLMRRDFNPDEELRNRALTIAVNAVTHWRKRGIHLLIGTQSLDTALLGDKLIRDMMRGFNGVGHRMDELSAHGGGILGDATKLPKDLPGAGYINGFDERPSAVFATKYAPELVKHGDGALTDIPRLAGIIADTPLQYDPAVVDLFGSWQIGHQHVFDTWYGRQPQGGDAASAPYTVQGASPAPPAAGEGIPLPTSDELAMVLGYLRDHPGWHSYTEIMREFAGQGLSLGAVKSVAAVLKSRGQAEAGEKKLQAA